MARVMDSFPAFLAVFVGGILAVVGGGFWSASFLVDCDAKIARWEAQEVACEERGGHWRARPVEMFCDGSLMLEPRGECWGDIGLNVEGFGAE